MNARTNAPVRQRWREAVIDRIERRTSRVASVYLDVALGAFEAGQHVDVRINELDAGRAERSYWIASPPGAPRVELAVERLDDGEVSPWFHEAARPGDTIEVRGPVDGPFAWRASDGGPILLVGRGCGVVPLMSMVRHRARASAQTSALLLCSARAWEEIIFRDELVAADATQHDFTFVATTTRGAKRRPADFERRVDSAMAREALERWGCKPRHVYVSGAHRFVEAATDALIRAGIAPDRIRTARYGGA